MISYCTLRYPILAIHVFQCQTSQVFELGTTFSINPAVQLGSQVAKGTGQHNSPVLPKPIPKTWSGSNLLCQRKHVVSIIHALVFWRFLRVSKGWSLRCDKKPTNLLRHTFSCHLEWIPNFFLFSLESQVNGTQFRTITEPGICKSIACAVQRVSLLNAAITQSWPIASSEE